MSPEDGSAHPDARSCTPWRRWLLPLAGYAALVLVVTAHHEPWRDEADVWLMVRDNGLGSLWNLMGYSGTPWLWHLVLYPFVKLGFPYPTEQLINNLIAIGAGAILLARAPFGMLTRLLIAGSFFCAFEYAVVARSYALTMLLFLAIAALHRDRLERPILYGLLIALLSNANAHSFLLAIVLGSFLAFDVLRQRSRRGLIGLALIGVGVGLAFAQLLPPPDGQGDLVRQGDRWLRLIGVFDRAFVPVTILNAKWASPVGLVINLTFLAAATTLLSRNRRAALFFWISAALLTSFFVFGYFGGRRHAGLLFLTLVFALWIARDERSPVRGRVGSIAGVVSQRVLLAGLALSCLATASFCWLEWKHPHSGAKDAARFLSRTDLSGKTLAGFSDPIIEAVLPYLPGASVWYAGIGDYGSYMKWDREYYLGTKMPYDIALMRIEMAHSTSRMNLLVLLNRRLLNPESRGYRLLYHARSADPPGYAHPGFGMLDENFYIYEPIEQSRAQLLCHWAGTQLRNRTTSVTEAANMYREAVRMDSTLAVAHIELGEILATSNDLADATYHLKKAASLDTSLSARVQILGLLGSLYAKQGRLEDALRAGKTGLELASSVGDVQSITRFEQQIKALERELETKKTHQIDSIR